MHLYLVRHGQSEGNVVTYDVQAGVREIAPEAVCEEGLPDDGFDFGLETPREAHERALRLVARLRSRFGPTEMKAAVVAHGTFNAFFLMAMMGRPWQRGAWIDQYNCCVNKAWMDPERVRILSLNDTSHLSKVTY